MDESVPIEMVSSHDSAVVRAELHMVDVLRGPGHRGGNVLLLDIQMVGVQPHAQSGAQQGL